VLSLCIFCTDGQSILDAVHLAAATQGCRLTATVDPVTSPCGSVSQCLRFVIEIVERVELVGNRISVKGTTPYEQKVGGKPAVR